MSVSFKGKKPSRRAFLKAFSDRGLEVISLNANGNPLHPTDPAQAKCLKDTIRVAGDMGIKTVCTMSGLPAGNATGIRPAYWQAKKKRWNIGSVWAMMPTRAPRSQPRLSKRRAITFASSRSSA